MTLGLPDDTIDRTSPVPFYFQLSEALEREISSGRWEPGFRLPSEPDFCDHFGISRTTVRQALARLEQDGLIVRDKGRGTFVAKAKPSSWLIQSTEGFFHADFVRTGHRVTSRLLQLAPQALPAWASGALGLPPGSDGVLVERVRAVDGAVALYVINCLPAAVADVVLALEPDESLYQLLAAKAGVQVIGGRRTVEAVVADDRMAELLEVEPRHPLAYIESVSWDADGWLVDCYRAWLRTDRMRIDLGVSAQQHDGRQLPDVLAVEMAR